MTVYDIISGLKNAHGQRKMDFKSPTATQLVAHFTEFQANDKKHSEICLANRESQSKCLNIVEKCIIAWIFLSSAM